MRHLGDTGGNTQRAYSSRPYPSFRFDSSKPWRRQADATTERLNLSCSDKRISLVAPSVLGRPYVARGYFVAAVIM